MRRKARLIACVLALGLSLGGWPALAGDGRFDPLLNSRLFSQLEESGAWDVSVSETMLSYNCRQCGGEVRVTLEIVMPYAAGGFGTSVQRYLAERKAWCADLARRFLGRCTGFSVNRWHLTLEGFKASHEIGDWSVTELVFFYHNNRYFGPASGPELIRGTMTLESGATPPDGTTSLLHAQMARLTAFY